MMQPTEPVEQARGRAGPTTTLGRARFAVAVPIAIAAAAVVYAIVAIPMYTLAQADPHGLDRPFFRHALVRIALAVRCGDRTVIGSVVGVW